jgi:hypothetical protein
MTWPTAVGGIFARVLGPAEDSGSGDGEGYIKRNKVEIVPFNCVCRSFVGLLSASLSSIVSGRRSKSMTFEQSALINRKSAVPSRTTHQHRRSVE